MKDSTTLNSADAMEIVRRIVARATELNKAAVIAVSDDHGELLAFARMDGAPLSSIRVAINKAYTAARERKPTKDIGDKVKHPEKGFDIAYYGDPAFVGWGGGIPIRWNDQVVGAIGVSGLSSAEDIELATFGLQALPKPG